MLDRTRRVLSVTFFSNKSSLQTGDKLCLVLLAETETVLRVRSEVELKMHYVYVARMLNGLNVCGTCKTRQNLQIELILDGRLLKLCLKSNFVREKEAKSTLLYTDQFRKDC